MRLNGDRKPAGSVTGWPSNVTLASLGAPSWTPKLPVTDNEWDSPAATVPAHTTRPVAGSVAMTQHGAVAPMATV